MAVTIKDIARVANVSHTTVSRALRNHPALSEETTLRIRQIADELGYVPNDVARGLKTSRSGVLGVIVRRIVDPFFSEVLQGIEDVLQDQEYSLFLTASHRNPEREKAIIRTMSLRRVDGVIICSTQVDEAHQRQLARLGVPSVLINNQSADSIAFSVYHDDRDGGRQIAEHLLALGHTRIGYLGNARGGRTNAERLAGFHDAMAAAGHAVRTADLFDAPNGTAPGGADGMQRFLASETLPTAIICYNDMMAIGAIQTLQNAGLRVPQDVSITGFDNIELAAYVAPPLTTFHQPKYELGREAARMMLRRLEREGNAEQEADVVILRGELRVRASTAPPRPE